tara:strand:+ start:628 stop:1674 length:1047 start_codon:yes stop_codon:yes gene_type:complete
MAYLGASPLASFASPSKDTFSGNNSTTSFTMGQSVGDPNQIEVFVDNVRQEPTSAYTVNGTTLSFTGTPATGSNNIYVIHKQGVIGNGLLPTSGRDSDRVGSLTVTGASTLTGNVTTSGNISATSGSITAGGALSGVTSITANGALSGVTTLTTSSTATIGGDTKVSGNLRSDTSADGIQIDASDGSATDAGDLILLDGTDGSATNAGSSLLYEDGTGDPANYFNNDITFSGDVELSKSVTAKTQVIESPGSTTTLDFDANQNFIVKLGASLTLNNSATGNLNIGQTGVLVFIQDSAGSRTLTLSSDFESPAAGGITLTTTANATDIVPYIILGPDRILLGSPQLAFG